MDKKIIFCGILSVLFFGTGCGRNYGGTFRGNATLTVAGQQATTLPVTIVLNNSNNNSITGSIQSSLGTGTITGGTIAGDRIDNVLVQWNSLNAVNTAGTTTTTTTSTLQTNILSSCGQFNLQGSFTFSNNENTVSASLNSVSSSLNTQYPNAQYPNTQSPYGTQYPNMGTAYYGNICSIQMNIPSAVK